MPFNKRTKRSGDGVPWSLPREGVGGNEGWGDLEGALNENTGELVPVPVAPAGLTLGLPEVVSEEKLKGVAVNRGGEALGL